MNMTNSITDIVNDDYYIVSREDLVDIADAIREKNNVDMPFPFILPTDYIQMINSGGGWTTEGIANGTEPSGAIVVTGTTIRHNAFSYCSGITSIKAVNLTMALKTQLANNPSVETIVIRTTNSTRDNSWFAYCANLAIVDFQFAGSQFGQSTFKDCAVLKTLILRNTNLISLWGGTTVFAGTPFVSGGSGGTIYIPKVLYDHLGDGSSLDYKAASTWSTFDGYGTITWAQIEGSQYENYYADGTSISN